MNTVVSETDVGAAMLAAIPLDLVRVEREHFVEG
jgi:hypothetical protein